MSLSGLLLAASVVSGSGILLGVPAAGAAARHSDRTEQNAPTESAEAPLRANCAVFFPQLSAAAIEGTLRVKHGTTGAIYEYNFENSCAVSNQHATFLVNLTFDTSAETNQISDAKVPDLVVDVPGFGSVQAEFVQVPASRVGATDIKGLDHLVLSWAASHAK
ncbi:MAG TPA: hypothetical protein VGG38_14020 [Acidimicrobiales bacterium]